MEKNCYERYDQKHVGSRWQVLDFFVCADRSEFIRNEKRFVLVLLFLEKCYKL